MAEESFYQVLGVGKDADSQAIKSAYRKLAKQYHPDQNPGDAGAERRFKQINEAYEVLKDEQSRTTYDALGHSAYKAHASGSGAGGMHPGAGGFAGFARDGGGFSSMSDIFGNLFDEMMGGQGRQRGNRQRGEDLRYDMTLSLEDACTGKRTRISVVSPASCTTCSGSGAAPGTKPVACSACGGSGRQRASQGFFTVERGCPQCQGRGQRIETPCRECGGSGRVRKKRQISVDIPAGIDNGNRIRLAGEGAPGAHGNGDLYIFVSIQDHSLFAREGADLFCRLPIAMTTAALGGEVKIPGLRREKLKIKIPPGCQNGHRLRLRSKGMPVLQSKHFGDLYVRVNVETPVNLSKRQREILAAFEAESVDATNPETHGFFGRVREFLDGIRE